MSDGNRGNVAEWMTAEAEGRAEEADRLFARLFAANVPRLAPSSNLADRVLASMSPFGPSAGWAVPRWGRAAVLALVCAGGLAGLSFWSVWVFDLLHASWAIAPQAVRLAGVLAGGLVHGWSNAAAVARPLTFVVTSPPGAAVLAAHLAVAAAASFALKRVLSLEEEAS